MLSFKKVGTDGLPRRPLVLLADEHSLPLLILRFLGLHQGITDVDTSCLPRSQDLLLFLFEKVVADFIAVHLYIGLAHDFSHRLGQWLLLLELLLLIL